MQIQLVACSDKKSSNSIKFVISPFPVDNVAKMLVSDGFNFYEKVVTITTHLVSFFEAVILGILYFYRGEKEDSG